MFISYIKESGNGEDGPSEMRCNLSVLKAWVCGLKREEEAAEQVAPNHNPVVLT